MTDSIIREVWKAKDAVALRHGHDVRRLVEHLNEREKISKAHVVDLHAGLQKNTKQN